jgi:hypothetical protein
MGNVAGLRRKGAKSTALIKDTLVGRRYLDLQREAKMRTGLLISCARFVPQLDGFWWV